MAHLEVFSASPQQGSKAAAHEVGPCLRVRVALLPEFGSWTVRVETVGCVAGGTTKRVHLNFFSLAV